MLTFSHSGRKVAFILISYLFREIIRVRAPSQGCENAREHEEREEREAPNFNNLILKLKAGTHFMFQIIIIIGKVLLIFDNWNFDFNYLKRKDLTLLSQQRLV